MGALQHATVAVTVIIVLSHAYVAAAGLHAAAAGGSSPQQGHSAESEQDAGLNQQRVLHTQRQLRQMQATSGREPSSIPMTASSAAATYQLAPDNGAPAAQPTESVAHAGLIASNDSSSDDTYDTYDIPAESNSTSTESQPAATAATATAANNQASHKSVSSALAARQTNAAAASHTSSSSNTSSSNSSSSSPGSGSPGPPESVSDASWQLVGTRDTTNFCVKPFQLATNVPSVGPGNAVGSAISASLNCASRPTPLNTLGGRCKITCDKPEDLKRVLMTETSIMAAPAALYQQQQTAAGASPDTGSRSNSTSSTSVGVNDQVMDPVHCQMTVADAPLIGMQIRSLCHVLLTCLWVMMTAASV